METQLINKMKLRKFGTDLIIRVDNRTHTCKVDKLPLTKGIKINGAEFLGYYDYFSGNLSYVAGKSVKPSTFMGNNRAVQYKQLDKDQQRTILDCLPRKTKPHG